MKKRKSPGKLRRKKLRRDRQFKKLRRLRKFWVRATWKAEPSSGSSRLGTGTFMTYLATAKKLAKAPVA